MRLTPRKEEVKAVVELLEADGFDSAQALAKEVIKTVWAELLKRDLWMLGNNAFPDSPHRMIVPYGPFSSETEAARFAKAAELMGVNIIRPVFSPVNALARHDERFIEETRVANGRHHECRCGHPTFIHEHHGFGGKCALCRTRCPKFVAKEAAA